MEMHTDMAVDPVTKRGRKMRRLLTAGHLDRRTRGVKRAHAIAAELERGWDGITPVQRQAIGRAAMLCAIAEDAVARRLSGEPIPISDVLRAEGVAKRAVRAVLAERPVPPAPPRFSPMKVLREEAARKAQANAGKEAQREAVTEKAPPNVHPAAD
jgi:hypothetical protein